jgi:formylglycine-generating enzyme required for sulfatase activity
MAFCNWLSEQDKLQPCYRQDAEDEGNLLPSTNGYRLPTEAEWEYACRAGTTTQYYFGDEMSQLQDYGWYDWNANSNRSRLVRLKLPNVFGLYDMHGNVFEYCQDWFASTSYSSDKSVDPLGPASGTHRVFRGGATPHGPLVARSAKRINYGVPSDHTGFRIICGLPVRRDGNEVQEK